MDKVLIDIMNLIETNTGIPLLAKDLDKWLEKEPSNKIIYEIYKMASQARNL